MLRKALTLTGCMLVLGVSLVSAKIWTVDSNQGNSASDFRTAQAAHDSASGGDTLYFSGSSIDYGTLTLTKKLTIIGPGYFLAQNLDLQANPADAVLQTVRFNSGSGGSIMMGIVLNGRLFIDANNITAKRNKIYEHYVAVEVNPSGGQTSVSNVIIAQSYIYNSYTSGHSFYGGISILDNCTGIFITNNYIKHNHADPEQQRSIVTGGTNTDVQVINNTLRGRVAMGDLGNFNNNILLEGSFGGGKITPRNNLSSGAVFGTVNGNQDSVDMATVFDSTQTTADGRWQLSGTSPAKGAGLNGEDCGMFGGMSPYVLSGIPPIPSIYHFTAPVSGSKAQGLPVRIKIRSNK